MKQQVFKGILAGPDSSTVDFLYCLAHGIEGCQDLSGRPISLTILSYMYRLQSRGCKRSLQACLKGQRAFQYSGTKQRHRSFKHLVHRKGTPRKHEAFAVLCDMAKIILQCVQYHAVAQAPLRERAGPARTCSGLSLLSTSLLCWGLHGRASQATTS